MDDLLVHQRRLSNCLVKPEAHQIFDTNHLHREILRNVANLRLSNVQHYSSSLVEVKVVEAKPNPGSRFYHIYWSVHAEV
jgi:hypothetical protein